MSYTIRWKPSMKHYKSCWLIAFGSQKDVCDLCAIAEAKKVVLSIPKSSFVATLDVDARTDLDVACPVIQEVSEVVWSTSTVRPRTIVGEPKRMPLRWPLPLAPYRKPARILASPNGGLPCSCSEGPPIPLMRGRCCCPLTETDALCKFVGGEHRGTADHEPRFAPRNS